MAGGPHERTAFLARPAPFFRNFSGANADGRRAGKDIEKVEIHVRTAARGAPLGAAPRAPPPARVGWATVSPPTDRWEMRMRRIGWERKQREACTAVL